MRSVLICSFALAVCLALPAPASAQLVTTLARLEIDGPPPPVPPETIARGEDGKVTMRAVGLEAPLTLDGALDEAVYRTVTTASNFVQQYPISGEPATEDTDVWVFFDNRNVYVSIRCWDSQPDRIVANEMRRDNMNIWMNDNVAVALDTFYDRRTAFFFQTNAVGGARDALIAGETATNYDWNTVWDVRTRRFDRGWTVEMAIPFKSLRYKPGSAQIWGINVRRIVKWKNEETLLSPSPKNYGGAGLSRLASAATLVGIVAPKASANLELKPYAISNLTTNRPAHISNDVNAAVGIDAKYGITSSLAFDVTYNTDFAQVEIDEQQVNLTRFSLFFPEKRDFFLEGQGIFEFAGSAGRGGFDDTPILFFTRRIGLNAGRPVPIQAGGRLMGRTGRTAIGLLNIETEAAPSAGAAATNFSVARIKRDVFRRSSIGLMVTNRMPSVSGGAPGSGSNQVYGVDANLSFFENVRVNGYYARSVTTGLHGDTESYRGDFQYDSDRYGLSVQRTKVGDGFNPEVGFVRRNDFQRTFANLRFSPRVTSIPGVRQLTWDAAGNYYLRDRDRVVDSQRRRASFQVEFDNSDHFRVDYFFRNYELIPEPFEVDGGLTVPAGAHRWRELNFRYMLGSQRRVSGTVNLERNGFYSDGRRTQLGYNGRVIFNAHLAVEPRVSMDWIDMPRGAPTAHACVMGCEGSARVTLLGARPIITIGPRMYVSALMQYNSSSHALETNVRWRWEYEPGSDLFVVYTDGRDTTYGGYPRLVNRGIAIKLTRFVRF